MIKARKAKKILGKIAGDTKSSTGASMRFSLQGDWPVPVRMSLPAKKPLVTGLALGASIVALLTAALPQLFDLLRSYLMMKPGCAG
jgi:hypothetical protein